MSQLEERQAEITEKQDTLNQTKQTLKEEFVGIDQVIDYVVNSISSWYLFPEIQEKPLVINLWGLTGVGKTSLVKRLSTLLGFEKQFYPFDLGEESKRGSDIKDEMERIFQNKGGYPIILALDEFQHARTLDQNGFEIADSHHRIIWQLLDTGCFYVPKVSLWIYQIYDFMGQLNRYLMAGVEVTNGMVSSGFKEFRELNYKWSGLTSSDEDSEDTNLQFVTDAQCGKIADLAPKMFSSPTAVKNKFLELDGPSSLEILQNVIEEANSPLEVDCSKGLIFVLGNLDEAYHMSGNQNADISADDFHKESLKINVPQIKQALKQRFRSEHIARLGNHHIIYPAMSRHTFEQLIERGLDSIAAKARQHFGLELGFHPTLHELLYSEGVYPTHGARPLLTTLYQMVQSRLGDVLSEMHTHQLIGCSVQFEAHSKGVLARFLRNEEACHSLLFEQDFELAKLRREKRDDVQAITAVHESGHTILAAILLHTAPKLVCAVTSEVESNGFAQIKHAWDYTAKRELIPRMAILLGGLMAEKVVFGEEHITDGAASDIKRATQLATNAIKEQGMGSSPGHFNVESQNSRFSLYDSDYQLNGEARNMLAQAAHLAEETLRQQETLLLHMANHLSDHRQLNQKEIIEMLEAHAVNFNVESLITNGDHLYYRNQLKKKVQKHRTPNGLRQVLTEGVILNGKKQTAH